MDTVPETHSADLPVARYRFDDVVVDAGAHTLERAGQPLAVEPKVFETLLVLLRGAGQLIPRDTLLDTVWGHRHVTPGVLTRAIAQLRDVLGDDAHHPRYIQTQHAVGYRFIGELVEDPPIPAGHDPPGEAGHTPVETVPPDPGTVALAPEAARMIDARAGPDPHRRRLDPLRSWLWPGLALLAVALALAPRIGHWVNSSPTAATAPVAASIAVLPFISADAVPGNDYFGEGLASEMLDALSDVKGLTVAAPVSPQLADHYRRDVKALGQVLGVATVLDATVQHEGDRVRINARLSDTHTGYTVWSHSYDHDTARIFDTQSAIASEVATALVGVLPTPTSTGLRKRLAPTRSVAAFDAYLRGLKLLMPDAKAADGTTADAAFLRALSEDPDFARAQAGLCRAEVSGFVNRKDASAFDRAQAACARASAMDPSMSEVNLALGELFDAKGEPGKAVDYYTRASSDPPRRVAAYVGIATVLSQQGKAAQALEYYNRALALDPRNGHIHAHIAYQHYLAGDLAGAIASYRKAVELRPDDALLWGYLGGVYIADGKFDEGENALRRSIDIEPTYAALTNLGELKFGSGRYADAVDLQRRALKLDSTDQVVWGNLGQSLLATGDAAGATRAFREAAMRAQRYVDVRADDATTLAALAFYRACLGDAQSARQLVTRSEALGREAGEVALYNAQTFARLGDPEQARKRIAIAREAGVAAYRIDRNPILRDIAKGGQAAVTTQ